MVPGVVGSSPISHPRQKSGDRGYPGPLLSSPLGRRQVVRQGTLTPSSAGSSPAVPAKVFWCRPSALIIWFDPIAQLAEQLPFKQWVRGSNPRRVTKSEQASLSLAPTFSEGQSAIFLLFESQLFAPGCEVMLRCSAWSQSLLCGHAFFVRTHQVMPPAEKNDD